MIQPSDCCSKHDCSMPCAAGSSLDLCLKGISSPEYTSWGLLNEMVFSHTNKYVLLSKGLVIRRQASHLCVYTLLCMLERAWNSSKMFSYSLHLKQISLSSTCSHSFVAQLLTQHVVNNYSIIIVVYI